MTITCFSVNSVVMGIIEYTALVSELFKLLKDILKRKKASQQEIQELKRTLVAVIKLAHDSAVDVLSYILPLKTAVACSTHSEELQRIIRATTGEFIYADGELQRTIGATTGEFTHSEELQRTIEEMQRIKDESNGKTTREIEDAINESFWNLRGRVDRRLKSHIHEIHRFREDFENASEYHIRAKKHIQKAYEFRRKNKRLCLDSLKMAEEELDALINYLSKRITEQITPLIETYENLT